MSFLNQLKRPVLQTLPKAYNALLQKTRRRVQGQLAKSPEGSVKNHEKNSEILVSLMSNAEEKQRHCLLLFDGFRLDLERRGLYRGQQRVRLTSKPLETLIFLVENRGRIVEKQELLDVVWKDTFVTEDTLVHAVREIRRALKDDKDNPRFVQTVPRRGYRFVSEVISGDASPILAER
jgi:DNA-binding winged helix-turn-helix (wHTH) protein